METLSTILTLFWEIPPITNGSPHKGPVTKKFDVFFALSRTNYWKLHLGAMMHKKHQCSFIWKNEDGILLFTSWRFLIENITRITKYEKVISGVKVLYIYVMIVVTNPFTTFISKLQSHRVSHLQYHILNLTSVNNWTPLIKTFIKKSCLFSATQSAIPTTVKKRFSLTRCGAKC